MRIRARIPRKHEKERKKLYDFLLLKSDCDVTADTAFSVCFSRDAGYREDMSSIFLGLWREVAELLSAASATEADSETDQSPSSQAA